MPKQQANNKSNNIGWVLKFIGSFAYLYVAFQLWLSPPAWLLGGPSASLPALGLGIIAATAIISSVGLFLMMIAGIVMPGQKGGMMPAMAWRMGMWSAFTLFVLTLPGAWSWLVLVGFVLYWIGSAMSKMQ